MREEPFSYAGDLSLRESCRVSLTFGPTPELIIGTGETACRIALRVDSFAVELPLVVNPTGLEGFIQGLETVLA
jgi:hypothetical protein